MNPSTKGKAKGRMVLRVAAVLIALAVLGELVLMALVYRTTLKAYPPARADAIIVLGARVYPDGALSLTLSRRTEKGFAAWQAGLAPALIVCGGQGGDEPVTEARAMADHLMALGVPQEQIFLEDESTSTYENLIHAKKIMRAQGMETALVVTSDYHMTRALWLCADVGITAQGYPSPGPDTRAAQLKALAQESLSWCKYALTKLLGLQ